jgi:hypothetical protein
VIVEEPSKDRQWRYDCLLCRDGKDVVALEVLHSHEFTREKASSVRDSGLEMTEFRGEDILHLLTESSNKTVHLENLLVQLGTCQSCVAKEDLEWMRTCWCDEYRELLHQVFDILDYYRNVEYKQLLEALERARCQLAALERCRRLVEKGVAWWLSCWHDELQELVCQEANVVSDYRNTARYSKLFTRQAFLSSCTQLPMHTPKARRLRSYAERATRWMARYVFRHLRLGASGSDANMPSFCGRLYVTRPAAYRHLVSDYDTPKF